MTYYEIEEMACLVCGRDYHTLLEEDRTEEIEGFLYDKLNVDIEQFGDMLRALLPFTPVMKGGLSDISYHAFINEKTGAMIVKQETNETHE